MSALNNIISVIRGLFSTGQNRAVQLSNRNLLIDGAFDQWAGGTATLTAGGVYASTVWTASCGTGGAASVSSSDIRGLPGQSSYDSGPQYAFIHNQTVAASAAPFIGQKVESVQKTAGRSLTLSMKLWCGSGTLNITQLVVQQNFGSGGSPSSTVILNPSVNWTVTTSSKRFSVRIDLPSITGKTFGSNSNSDFTYIGIYLPTGVTFALGLAEAQLEYSDPQSSSDITGNGGAPTAFEYRGQQAELARVQRYYESCSMASIISNGGGVYGGAVARWPYKVTKRGAPAISLATTGGNATTGLTSSTDTNSIQYWFASNATVNQYYDVFLTAADARL